MKHLYVILVVAVLAVAGWAVYAKVSGSCCPIDAPNTEAISADPRKGAGVGSAATPFSLTKPDGSKITLDTLSGKPAILAFWSTYCSGCKKETPHLNQLNEAFASRGVRVIGVNVDTTEARMNEGVSDFGINYEYAWDVDRVVAKGFKVVGTPTVIILDPTGKIVYSANKLPEDSADRIEALLAQEK